MSQDNIKLLITKTTGQTTEIDEFISYSLDSDLFQAGDAFEIVINGSGPSPVDVKRGDTITILVNGQPELIAIANKPRREYVRGSGSKITIKGVDFMGLLTSHHIEIGQTFENISTEDIVEQLIADVKFINLKNFKIHASAKNDLTPQSNTSKFALKAQSPKAVFRTRPGETVFNALRRFALSKGVLFFNKPDGTLVLGGLINTGTPFFWLTTSNILKMNEKEDTGQSFSKVVLLGQKQAAQTTNFAPITADDIRFRSEVIDPDFPYEKPFVAISKQGGSQADLDKQAALKMAELKAAEIGLNYTVAGHSQGQSRGRRNWQTNMVAGVFDPLFPDLNGDYLIAGRRFAMDKDNGTTTQIRLTKLGFSPV